MSELPTLEFVYTNWRGDTHVYVIEPEKIECGPYDATGMHPREPEIVSWVLHGKVVTRDGDPRPEMGATRRRTFLLGEVRELRQVETDE